MRFAIIGSGISGLVSAYLLRREHEVTVFEAADRIGGHTHTVEVDSESGAKVAVDSGFIVYNEPNYPLFSSLLAQLGVATQPTLMSFSVRCDRTGLEYNGTDLNGIFAQRRNLLRPRFLGMLRDILRFGREGRRFLEEGGDDSLSVEGFVARGRYGEAFRDHYLLPLGAALWSVPLEGFASFPVRFVLEFLENHRMLNAVGRPEWRVVSGGSQRYVEALTAGFVDRIRLSTPIDGVRRSESEVRLRLGSGGEETFDQVVLACHADQALRLLGDATPEESEVLAAFPYQPNDVVLHDDPDLLPRSRRAWASWNYRLPRSESADATVTYNMKTLQGLDCPEEFSISLNETEGIDPARIRGRYRYEHPIYDERRAAAQARHGEFVGARRTSFCGAYWGYGFHEDGVRSAVRVAEAFGIPWEGGRA